LKTGVGRAFRCPTGLGVPVSHLGVPVGVPVLVHRIPMKRKDLTAVYQCTSSFLKKPIKKQYLGVPTIVPP
jgi:hypothetical protein